MRYNSTRILTGNALQQEIINNTGNSLQKTTQTTTTQRNKQQHKQQQHKQQQHKRRRQTPKQQTGITYDFQHFFYRTIF
jgi:hypothetical protein